MVLNVLSGGGGMATMLASVGHPPLFAEVTIELVQAGGRKGQESKDSGPLAQILLATGVQSPVLIPEVVLINR